MTAVVTSAADVARTDDHDGHILAAARGTGFLALGSFFEFASRFLIALMLARILGADDYGLYVLSVSAAAIFAGLSGLGLDDAMVRYVAILSGRRDQPGVLGTIRIGVGVSTVAGIVMGIVLFVLARPLAEGLFSEPRLTHMLQLLAFVVPFLTVSNVLAGPARVRPDGLHRARRERRPITGTAGVAGNSSRSVRGLNVSAAVIIFGISDVAATVTFVLLLHRYLPLGPSRQAGGSVRRPGGVRLRPPAVDVGAPAPAAQELRDAHARRLPQPEQRRHLLHREQGDDGRSRLPALAVHRGQADTGPAPRSGRSRRGRRTSTQRRRDGRSRSRCPSS